MHLCWTSRRKRMLFVKSEEFKLFQSLYKINTIFYGILQITMLSMEIALLA